MTPKNTADRYGSLSIGMHWLMVLLLVAVYAAINLHDLAPKGSDLRADLKLWHFTFGLSIFALVLARLGLRALAGSPPAITPPPPRWQAVLAQAMHVALYLFMIAMPLIGWLTVSSKGVPVTFLGLPLPAVGRNEALHEWFEELHEFIGIAGYYLIGLHAAAALVHHYFMRDNTLRRMLPALR